MTVDRFTVYEPGHGGYTVIWNHAANNPELSAKAKGILWYLLTKKEDWHVYEADIVKHMKDGLKSIRSGIKELIKAEYIKRDRRFKDNGQFDGWEYSVFHLPKNQKPKAVKSKKSRENKYKVTAAHGLTGNQIEATVDLVAVELKRQANES